MNEQSVEVVIGVGHAQEYRAEVVVWNVEPEGDLTIRDHEGHVIGTHARGQWLYVMRVARIEDSAAA